MKFDGTSSVSYAADMLNGDASVYKSQNGHERVLSYPQNGMKLDLDTDSKLLTGAPKVISPTHRVYSQEPIRELF